MICRHRFPLQLPKREGKSMDPTWSEGLFRRGYRKLTIQRSRPRNNGYLSYLMRKEYGKRCYLISTSIPKHCLKWQSRLWIPHFGNACLGLKRISLAGVFSLLVMVRAHSFWKMSSLGIGHSVSNTMLFTTLFNKKNICFNGYGRSITEYCIPTGTY